VLAVIRIGVHEAVLYPPGGLGLVVVNHQAVESHIGHIDHGAIARSLGCRILNQNAWSDEEGSIWGVGVIWKAVAMQQGIGIQVKLQQLRCTVLGGANCTRIHDPHLVALGDLKGT